jgi:hypothetical protein
MPNTRRSGVNSQKSQPMNQVDFYNRNYIFPRPTLFKIVVGIYEHKKIINLISAEIYGSV